MTRIDININGVVETYDYQDVPALSKVAEEAALEYGRDGINDVYLARNEGDGKDGPVYHFRVARSTTVHTSIVEEN